MLKRMKVAPATKLIKDSIKEAVELVLDKTSPGAEEEKIQGELADFLSEKKQLVAQRNALNAEIQKQEADKEDWEKLYLERAKEAGEKLKDLSPEERVEAAKKGDERPMQLDQISRALESLKVNRDGLNKAIAELDKKHKVKTAELENIEIDRQGIRYQALWDLILGVLDSFIPMHGALVKSDGRHKELVKKKADGTWTHHFARQDVDGFCQDFRANMLSEVATADLYDFVWKLLTYRHKANKYHRDRKEVGFNWQHGNEPR